MDHRKQAVTITKVGLESKARTARKWLRSLADPEVVAEAFRRSTIHNIDVPLLVVIYENLGARYYRRSTTL